MKRRARTLFLVLAASLAAGCVVLFLWLPWNPLEADAGPLDEWVPADVEAVVRFDAGALRSSPALQALWDGPAGFRVRDEFELDNRVAELRWIGAQLASLPSVGGDPPKLEDHLVGREVLVALRGEDVLVISRISELGKAVDLIRRAGEARRKHWGVRIDGDAYVVGIGEGLQVRFARRRDVLLVSMSQALLSDALTLADGRGNSLAAQADYLAQRPEAPRDSRVAAWARGSFVRRLVGEPPMGASVVRGAFEAPISLTLDLSDRNTMRLAGTFAGGSSFDVSELHLAARRLTGDVEVVADGALPITSREAVQVLFDSQPAARRRLVEDLLAERGSSVESVVEAVSALLADGLGFVVARLPETDALRLDDPQGDTVEPIPATFVIFRLSGGDSGAFVAVLRRHAQSLFGADAALEEETAPGGARMFRTRASLGAEWELLRPAVALVGDEVIFSTNVAALRRALANKAQFSEDLQYASMRVNAPELKAMLLDQRWNVADRSTRHDWVAERRAVRRDVAARGALSSSEAKRREDDEMARRIRRRDGEEFRAALTRYADSLRWLDSFGRARAAVYPESKSRRLEVEIGIAER